MLTNRERERERERETGRLMNSNNGSTFCKETVNISINFTRNLVTIISPYLMIMFILPYFGILVIVMFSLIP
jgi:hypothetical protein